MMTLTPPVQSVSLNLTHDELVWLLAAFRLPPMIGMTENYFPGETNDETVQARIAAGEASLRARGLLRSSNDEIGIDALVMGMLGAYAFAQGTVVLTVNGISDANTLVVYYQSVSLTVEHTMIDVDVHRFTVVADNHALTDTVLAHFPPLNPSGWTMPPQAIPASVLGDAIQAAKSGDPVNANAMLQTAGWDANTCAAFVHVLTTQAGGASLAVIRAAPPNPNGERGISSENSAIVITAPDATAHITTLGTGADGIGYSAVAFVTPDEMRADVAARLRIGG